jgi:Methyltransferase domain
MIAAKRLDEKYYQVLAPQSLGERVAIAARNRIYSDFIRTCRPDPKDSILDVGVSDVVSDAANVLERKYPYPDKITAAGLGSAEDFRAAFPAVRYVRIAPNHPLPFKDGAFDIATANAVLEHVRSRDNQEFFIGEMLRVARKIFVSVPNRLFPVEHHTAIPFLHFWDKSFIFACKMMNADDRLNEKNPILMSKAGLATLVPSLPETEVDYTGIRLGRFGSNLFLAVEK